MYLTAALLPPPHIARDVHEFAAAHSAMAPDQVRSLASGDPWDVMPLARMAAQMTRFGYVAPGEVDAMRLLVADLIAPHDTFTVSLGGQVHVDHVRKLVLLGLQGETDRLEEVVDALHASVRRAGFAQDRRRFKPLIPVLSFRPSLRLGSLVRTVEALEGYTSEAWTVTSIGLVHREVSGRDARPTALEHLSLSA